jgi:hypothetical protein
MSNPIVLFILFIASGPLAFGLLNRELSLLTKIVDFSAAEWWESGSILARMIDYIAEMSSCMWFLFGPVFLFLALWGAFIVAGVWITEALHGN